MIRNVLLRLHSVAFCLLCVGVQFAVAQQSLFNREMKLIGGYVNNAASRWDKTFFLTSLGFEHYKKYSSEYGDFLTHDIQARFTWDFRQKPADAWAVEIHNAWLDFKLALGHTLRIGHFEPCFGLEVYTDTHGTLVQTLLFANAGVAHDWGAGYKTYVGIFDVRAAAQLGMGMSFREYKRNFLFSTRIGAGEGGNAVFGVSGLYGRVYSMKHAAALSTTDTTGMEMHETHKPDIVYEETVHPTFPVSAPGPIVKRWRAGYDFSYTGNYLRVKHEAAAGRSDGVWVGAGLVQVEYPFAFEKNLVALLQVKALSQDLKNRYMSYLPITVGADYTVLKYLSFRAAYEITVLPFDHEAVANHKVRAMIYYFGK